MSLSDLASLIAGKEMPVLLLEGRRSIPAADFRRARETAIRLAEEFPMLHFRSGNADGTDQAFADGVTTVDPGRLQVVTPYEGHRARYRHPDAHATSPESLSLTQEEHLAAKTIEASPRIRGIIERRASSKALAAKARYLIRDTMKVVGPSEALHPPVAALFYVNLDDPDAGGTGHSIRVCRQQGVPCAFQDSWGTWFR